MVATRWMLELDVGLQFRIANESVGALLIQVPVLIFNVSRAKGTPVPRLPMTSSFVGSKSGSRVESRVTALSGHLVDVLAGKSFQRQMINVNVPLESCMFSKGLSTWRISRAPELLPPFVGLLMSPQTCARGKFFIATSPVAHVLTLRGMCTLYVM